MRRGALDILDFVFVVVKSNFLTSGRVCSCSPFWRNPLCTGPSSASNIVNMHSIDGIIRGPAIFSIRVNINFDDALPTNT